MHDVVPQDCMQTLNHIVENTPCIENIVLLGVELEYLKQELLIEFPVTVLSPDWMSPVALYSIYQQANHIVFVDTLRSMDAAFTGCCCTVMFSAEFQKDHRFPIWNSCLSKASDCKVIDSGGSLVKPVVTIGKVPFLICENNLIELEKAIKVVSGNSAGNTDEYKSFWLDGLPSGLGDAVVTLSGSSSGARKSDARDRLTGLSRKWDKLRHDPYAFFIDSRIGVLRKVAKIFSPARSTG